MPEPLNTSARLERYLPIAILLLLLIGCLLVMRPFISDLAWACVMAFSLWPAHRRLVARLGNRRTIAALLMTSLIAMVLLLPTFVIVVNLADDARQIGGAARRMIDAGPPAPPAWLRKVPFVGNRAATYWQDLATEGVALLHRSRSAAVETEAAESPATVPTTQVSPQGKLAKAFAGLIVWARTWLPTAGLMIVNGITHVVLSVLLTFFIFRDGEALATRLDFAIERIGGERGTHLLQVAGSTVRGVVYGILGTALVQALMASVGFLIAGVPGAALLGLITFLLSPVPFGPVLVWLPASLWLFSQDASGWGIFMIIWGIAVSSIDNVVKPWIISQGSATPFLLVFFGIVGGALTFGFIGVFLGPTLLAVAYRLIEEWSRDSPQLPKPATQPP